MTISQIIKFFTIVLVLIYSKCAWAGHSVIGGGIVVKCISPGQSGNDDKIDYALLDFFENFREPYSRDLEHTPSAAQNELDIAFAVVHEIARVDHVRSARYVYWLSKFFQEVSFVDNSLPRTMDAGLSLELPEGCQLIQGIVQMVPEQEGKPRYYIQRSIWDAMSQQQRAGLLVHELVLRDALQQGIDTTEGVRKFVRFLFSQEIQAVSSEGFQDQLKVSGLSASSLSTTMMGCKSVISDMLENRVITSNFVEQKRNFESEIANGQRVVSTRDLRVSGSELVLPMLIKSRFEVFELPIGQNIRGRFLRLQESSKGVVFRIYQRRSSDTLFATFEPYENDITRSAPSTITGTVTCSPSSIHFIGEDVGYTDYQVGTGEYILSKSVYSMEWSIRNDQLEENAVVTTRKVDPSTLMTTGILGTGWHD